MSILCCAKSRKLLEVVFKNHRSDLQDNVDNKKNMSMEALLAIVGSPLDGIFA